MNFATGFNFPPFWLDRPTRVPPADRAPDGENRPAGAVALSGESSPSDDVSRAAIDIDVPRLGNFFRDRIMLRLEDEAEWWSPLLDPIVSVSGKNTVVRRNVAKADAVAARRGSVKELWSVDDYEINIAGTLTNFAREELPDKDLKKLRDYCEAKRPVLIESRLLSLFGVRRIAIVEYSLPFTKGLENQSYALKAYSDDEFDLLIE